MNGSARDTPPRRGTPGAVLSGAFGRDGRTPAWTLHVRTSDAASTRELGTALAQIARAGDVVLLSGSLGAGKTTLAQGFAEGLGVAGPVVSPTFTLVREYECAGDVGVGWLLHADVYRVDSLNEVADLGLGQLVEDGAVLLVEWGDVAAPVLGSDSLEVAIEMGRSEDERAVTVSGSGAHWTDRHDETAAALARFAPGSGSGRGPAAGSGASGPP